MKLSLCTYMCVNELSLCMYMCVSECAYLYVCISECVYPIFTLLTDLHGNGLANKGCSD